MLPCICPVIFRSQMINAGKVESVFVTRSAQWAEKLRCSLNIAGVEKYARKTCDCGQPDCLNLFRLRWAKRVMRVIFASIFFLPLVQGLGGRGSFRTWLSLNNRYKPPAILNVEFLQQHRTKKLFSIKIPRAIAYWLLLRVPLFCSYPILTSSVI